MREFLQGLLKKFTRIVGEKFERSVDVRVGQLNFVEIALESLDPLIGNDVGFARVDLEFLAQFDDDFGGAEFLEEKPVVQEFFLVLVKAAEGMLLGEVLDDVVHAAS
jgi:hypothetical protein